MIALGLALAMAGLLWIRAVRYMAVALLLGVGAYQASVLTSLNIEPQHVVALMFVTLMGTLLADLLLDHLKKSTSGGE